MPSNPQEVASVQTKITIKNYEFIRSIKFIGKNLEHEINDEHKYEHKWWK